MSARRFLGRLLGVIPTLLITWTFVFGAMRLVPGDPVLLMLQGTPVQVIVVDWHMPVMDGIEFTERFRAELPGDTYVIMLTARKDDFDFERGYRAGVDDYLTKGVREPELMARIHAGMNTFSLRTQLREARAALQLAVRGREGN